MDNSKINPGLSVLSEGNIALTHDYSINILENTGIRVESKSALELFAKSGGTRIEGDVVYIQNELVKSAIKSAKSEIEIFNQEGTAAFKLGKGHNTRFGLGVTNTNYQDIETDQLEIFQRKHTRTGTILGNALLNFDLISTIGIPADVETKKLDLINALDLYANTSRPIMILVSESKRMRDVYELLSHLHGDISTFPFVIPYFNPVTPLVLNKDTSDKILVSLEYDLPVCYSNYSMYGGTSPITEGGTLALLNAELLAGLVFCQLVKEGSEIILGSLPAGFNMQTMGSYYSSSSYLLNIACAEMMDHYKIPHCGTSGSGNAYGPDLIAAGDLWINHLTSCIGKVGIAPFVGGNFDSTAFSPTTVVLSDHIIGQARKFSEGFSIDSDTVRLDEIKNIGHGGNYLTSDQTLSAIGSFDMNGALWPPMTKESWQEKGNPQTDLILKEYTRALVEKGREDSVERQGVIEKGEEYITEKLI
jgi:trimethylamine--corrinoid protein Co-methyltransferase